MTMLRGVSNMYDITCNKRDDSITFFKTLWRL